MERDFQAFLSRCQRRHLKWISRKNLGGTCNRPKFLCQKNNLTNNPGLQVPWLWSFPKIKNRHRHFLFFTFIQTHDHHQHNHLLCFKPLSVQKCDFLASSSSLSSLMLQRVLCVKALTSKSKDRMISFIAGRMEIGADFSQLKSRGNKIGNLGWKIQCSLA